MPQQFRYLLRVRYGECDAQKVVFNVHYGHYVDLAVLEFIRALGSSPMSSSMGRSIISWSSRPWSGKLRPASIRVLEISVRAKHLGNTSFTLGAEFRIAGEEAVIVTAETIYVLVDAVTLTKMPLPADLPALLSNGAAPT